MCMETRPLSEEFAHCQAVFLHSWAENQGKSGRNDQWPACMHDKTESIVISSIVISVPGRTRADLRPLGTHLAFLLPQLAAFLRNI